MKIFTKRGSSFFLKSIVPMGFLVLFFVWNALGQNQEIRTAPGNYTFSVPTGVTSITVEAWGGGGRGGTRTSNGNSGGGGGGAYSRSVLSVTPGQTFSYTVGAGSTNANAGGESFFGNTSTVMAKGGNSVPNNNVNGATGGQASEGFGAIRFSGGNGATGSGTFGGGGGSSAGNAQIGTSSTNQNGAIAPAGGGNGANGRSGSQGNGESGISPGGGGGGAYRTNAAGGDRIGGNGANGQIRISWCSIALTSAPGTTNQSGICLGNPITPITYSITGASTASFSGLPNGVSGTINAGIITISGTPTEAGLNNYTVTITDGNCIGTELTGSIQVTPNNAAGTITANTFCRNSPIPANIFQPTNVATGIGTPSGLPAGVSASFNINLNQIEFTGTPTQTGVFNYSIPLTGGCGTVNATGTITINEVVAIVDENLAGQSSCPGTPFNPISVGEGFGLTYQWYSNTTNTNSGGTPISGATSHTYTPSSATVGTTYYYVAVSGACGSTVNSPVSGAFVVNPGNSVTPASSSPTVCINSAIGPITHTTTSATGINSTGNNTGVNGLPPGVSATWSGNQITISGTPTAYGVFNYNIPLTGGCGTVAATGTITVNAAPEIITPNLPAQSSCLNEAFSPISVGQGTGLSYQWYSNTSESNTGGTLISGATSNSFTPPSNAVGQRYYYVVVTSSCGTSVVSSASGLQEVFALPTPSFTSQPPNNICVDEDRIYTTQAGQSNYQWVLPGTQGTDYTIVSGGTAADNTITVRWLTPGNKSLSVNYTNPNGCRAVNPTNSNTITVRRNGFTPPASIPSVCVNTEMNPVFIGTSLATGIGTPTGLPDGVTASWASNSITLTGTPLNPGTYNYQIPLTGGCGTVSATGTLVVTPVYELTSTTSVSPSAPGGSATVTIRGNTSSLPNGTYTITYSLGQANSGTFTTTVNVQNGRGTFITVPIPNLETESLTSIEIQTIRRQNDSCTIALTEKNLSFFGLCPAIDYATDGDFFVPAGITEITVRVWGGGGKGGNSTNSIGGGGGGGGGYSTATIPVSPGQRLRVVVGTGGNTTNPNGGTSLITRSESNDTSNALIFATGGQAGDTGDGGQGGNGNSETGNPGASTNVQNGGNGGQGGGNGGAGGLGSTQNNNNNGTVGSPRGGGGGGARGNGNIGKNGGSGRVIISYPCPPIDPTGCFKVIDDGSRSGTTVIEFTCEDSNWIAPEGLADFTVVAIGAGGGGGMGNAAGGGGAGGLNTGYFSTSEQFGMPDGTTFNIKVGQGGIGATSTNVRGGIGNPSSVTGLVDGVPINVIAPGGGGGGSYNSGEVANGIPGASGGGGAYHQPTGYSGFGGAGQSGIGWAGNSGAVGQGNSPAVAGGGGGGAGGIGGAAIITAGSGRFEAGNGGSGRIYNNPDHPSFQVSYGAGGGGTGSGGNALNSTAGAGGSAPNVGTIGGAGNLSGVGSQGRDGTGSGGGAGITGGGRGGSGVVYIIYENLRILPVEFIYFQADYNSNRREATLNWATAKEWENSHFEVERSIIGIKGFEKVGEVEGMGWTDQVTEYQFIDQQLPLGSHNVLYRLKQVDFSGEFQYSDVVSLRLPGVTFTHGVWRAYPNPTNGTALRIALMDRSQYDAEKLTFRIVHPMYVTAPTTVESEDKMNELLSNLALRVPKGVFVVEIQWGQKVEHIKILKQH
ncbi:beta strand repeat-containing protein [Arthrospiribacter ruber]|uniref:Glycine-rich domain-containing protein n=1 Tax=Arthrospiribacter ruber TaxID=2487934 RepID=A0A951MH00_9BACT|nr:hypothetical protein [Arthrospiribacter ruber]MBW3469206.1 hypothetical protein [Arthrospiribacter ruber]